jgi:hypothetical protein
LEGNIFTKTIYPASFLVYGKLLPFLPAKQKTKQKKNWLGRNQTSAISRIREQARQCSAPNTKCSHPYFFFLHIFHDIPFYWLFSVIVSMSPSFCLPHGFNLSFSRHTIVIVTGLMDILHNDWILFTFNFIFKIYFWMLTDIFTQESPIYNRLPTEENLVISLTTNINEFLVQMC